MSIHFQSPPAISNMQKKNHFHVQILEQSMKKKSELIINGLVLGIL